MLSNGYVATSGKLRENISVLRRRWKVDRELDDRTFEAFFSISEKSLQFF